MADATDPIPHPWEVQYTAGQFMHGVAFTTKRSAAAVYRRFIKARADYRPYSNDGSALFTLRGALTEATVNLANVDNISLVYAPPLLERNRIVQALRDAPAKVEA